jgi:hypothetical protein
VLAVAAGCWFLERHGHRGTAVAAIVLCVTASVVFVIWTAYPILDQTVSARGIYRAQAVGSPLCAPGSNRSLRYGLDYYAHHPIPDCK